MRQYLANLPLASAPLMIEREREQEEEHLSKVLYLPCCTSHGQERARGASPPLIVMSMCIPA
jgi:hypothetical protein